VITVGDDPIDREVLARLDFGDPPGELLALLVATFLEHAPANVTAMQAGAARGDAPAVRLAAHSLKSSARQFGALHLGELCEAIEHEAGEGRVDPAAVADAARELDRARAALSPDGP
jgi:HPt (histidine-containing phosphotransfer) domain-containing protein